MRRLTVLDITVLLATAALFLFLFRGLPSSQPYVYDESDYMNAGERGLVDNFLERPSTSFIGFLRIGLDHQKLDKRSSLSELARGSRDIDFYRHFHGPVYYYFVAVVSPLVHGAEYWMHFSGFFFHLLTFFTIALGIFWLTGYRTAALVASFLYLFGQASMGTAAIVSPHAPYVFFTTLTLLLFAAYLKTGIVRLWYLTVAAFAGAFCSIDYAILLAVTFALCLFQFRRERRLPRAVLLRSAALFLAILLLLWPMGVLQLNALKGYFFIAYLAMQRKGSYGDYGPFTIWWQRFLSAPVEYSLDLLALVGVFALWRHPAISRYRYLLLPSLVYAFFMLLTTLKNTSLNPTYVASILPPFAIVTGVALAALSERSSAMIRAGVTAVVLAATVLGGYSVALRRAQDPPGPNPDAQLISTLRASGMSGSTLVVPYEVLPVLTYYFPNMRLHSYISTDDAAVVQDKMRAFDARAIVYRPRPDDALPALLKQSDHMKEQLVGDSLNTRIYQIDGHS